jgi:AcrR family transcriptional regulator
MRIVSNYQLEDLKEPVQERSKKTRKNILDAARELFSEDGFEETTTHSIADRVGISVGGLYAHFKNKEEIFLNVLEQRSREIYEVTKDTVEKIRAQGMGIDEGLDHYFKTIYNAHIAYGKLNFEMNKFITMNERAEAIHDYWEWEEAKEVVKWLEQEKEEISIEDKEAAMIVMGRSVHEVFHYLYKNRDKVDEWRILNNLVIMLKKYIRR